MWSKFQTNHTIADLMAKIPKHHIWMAFRKTRLLAHGWEIFIPVLVSLLQYVVSFLRYVVGDYLGWGRR